MPFERLNQALLILGFGLLVATAGAEAPDALGQAREARGDLADFYLRTFEANLQGNFYEKERQVVLLNHLAHRLWVPDPGRVHDLALKQLTEAVQTGEITAAPETPSAVPDAATTQAIPLAFFPDELQVHRDQYAMILSEMGIDRLGDHNLSAFIHAARGGAGARLLSELPDLAWTVALLARHTRPGEAWQNFDGETLDLPALVEQMKAIDVRVDPDDVFSCYRYHELYALAAAVDAGYEEFREEFLRKRSEALEHALAVVRASQERGDLSEELSGRSRITGHLLEAWYRAPDAAEPTARETEGLGELIEVLAADAARLADLAVYLGPPDVFVNIPHAIHGLDLYLAAAEAGTGAPEEP